MESIRLPRMRELVGKAMPPSEWFTVTQDIINAFADVTQDHNWIHVDVERASKELPGGSTIAHGYLILSLLPHLRAQAYKEIVGKRSRGLNYGTDKLRFIAPVPAGSRVRLTVAVKAVEPVSGGVRLVMENTVEVEGGSRPALVSESIDITYD